MAIELAPLVHVKRSESKGHCGLRVEYCVHVTTPWGDFYPVRGGGYGSPWVRSEQAAHDWAKMVGDMLGLDVVNDY